jgi:AmmeMemoRadiSam system protein B
MEMKKENNDSEEFIRPPAVAGTFYPDEPSELREMITDFLDAAGEVSVPGKLRALVVPHAGYIYSGPTAAFGYKLLAQFAKKVKNIVMLGPSHYAGFSGLVESGMSHWQTPLGVVKTKSLADLTNEKKLIAISPQAHLPEHSLEVQVPFLQMTIEENFSFYPALTGDLNPREIGQLLERADSTNTVFIASSDLSHYNPYEKAKLIDEKANKYVPALDITNAEKTLDACGRNGILSLMHLAKANGWKGKLLDYRNSGDTAGDRIRVVGYGAYAFYEE